MPLDPAPVLPNPPRLIDEEDEDEDGDTEERDGEIVLEPDPPLGRYDEPPVERYPDPPHSHQPELDREAVTGTGSGAHAPLVYTHGRP